MWISQNRFEKKKCADKMQKTQKLMVIMFKQTMEMYNDTFANYAKAALLTYFSLTLIVLMFIITSHHLSGFKLFNVWMQIREGERPGNHAFYAMFTVLMCVMVFFTCFSIEERWKRVSSVNEYHDIAIALITCAKYHAPWMVLTGVTLWLSFPGAFKTGSEVYSSQGGVFYLVSLNLLVCELLLAAACYLFGAGKPYPMRD